MTSISRSVAALLLLASADVVVGQDPLVAATNKRQAATQSFEVKFHIKELVAKGSYSVTAAEMPGGKTGLAIPAEDTTIESDNRLAIDGPKVRFEKNHPIWHLPIGQLTRTQTIAATDGELSKVFYPGGVGVDTEVTGIILRDARNGEAGIYHLTPIMMHFRGADPQFASYNVQTVKKGTSSLPIGGKLCHDYQRTLSKDVVVELWYDTASCELARIRKLRRGIPYEQYEIQYRAVPGLDSAPMSWVRTEYDGGKIRKTATVTAGSTHLELLTR